MSKYKKPFIKTKKLKLSLFYSQRVGSAFFDGDGLLLAPSCTNGLYIPPCFIKDTKILMANKTTKSIQQIKPGESVLSYNISKSRFAPNKVLKLITNPKNKAGYYIINDLLKVTGNHPVFINGSKWEIVRNLLIGKTLLDTKQKQVLIKKIEKVEGSYVTYDLHLLGESHNYFAEGVLVHNGCTS